MASTREHLRVDLNVTPLIDVLLVLLVIFLAALPLAQQALETTVPAQVQSEPQPRVSQLVLRYEANGHISLNQEPIAKEHLAARLRELYSTRTDKTLFLMGDGTLRYKAIIEVIDAAKGAGVTSVGVVTEGMRARAPARSQSSSTRAWPTRA